MTLFIFFFTILINFILFKNLNFFEKIFRVTDIPDYRKIHKISVPLLGGTFFIINIFIIFLATLYTNFNLIEFNINLFEIYSICFGIISFYILGLIDDKNKMVSPINRLIFSFLIILFLMILDSNLRINSLKISFIDSDQNNSITLPFYLSWILTIISFLVLINAFNMTDGINLLFSSYLFFVFLIMFYLGILNMNLIVLIPFFIFFFINNYKSKIFFGSSGIMPSSFLVGYIFIKSYNYDILIYSDWVFVILFIPLVELLRLVVLRLKNNRHIFQADQNHLHHYIYFNFQYPKSIFIVLIIYFLPSLIVIFNISTQFIFIILIIYLYLIFKYRK